MFLGRSPEALAVVVEPPLRGAERLVRQRERLLGVGRGRLELQER